MFEVAQERGRHWRGGDCAFLTGLHFGRMNTTVEIPRFYLFLKEAENSLSMLFTGMMRTGMVFRPISNCRASHSPDVIRCSASDTDRRTDYASSTG